jgi:hypothetical protein
MEAQLPQAGPLTYEQVAEEYGRAFTDPAHEMYDAARRGLPAFEKWVDALYARIAGGDVKVTPGEAVIGQPPGDDAGDAIRKCGHAL